MMRAFPMFIVALMAGACVDAPRDNPLDPLSSSYFQTTTVTGLVTVAGTTTPIAGATVRCVPGDLQTVTNASGRFSYITSQSGNLSFICAATGFTADTLAVTVSRGMVSLEADFQLNGAPVVGLKKILTHKVDQYFPSPQYYVDILADVSDPNGPTDIDSIAFIVDTLKRPMIYSLTDKVFELQLFKYDFPTNTIQWLVGRSLMIRTRDKHGAISVSAPFAVTRIIENGATLLSPALSETASARPLLIWSPPSVTFTYTYSVSISRVIGGVQTVVWTVDNVSSVVESASYPGDGTSATLPSGNYVWSVTVVDEFGNTCRSKEAAFIVP